MAAKAALDTFPTVRGRLALVRRTWHRGDTAMVQLVAAPNQLNVPSPAESTLVVWVAAGPRVVRAQWVLEVDPSRPVRSNGR